MGKTKDSARELEYIKTYIQKEKQIDRIMDLGTELLNGIRKNA